MTDRPNHRAEAEYLLFDADVRAAQAGEPTLGELSSLAYSAVHALLAIHDTLTAADRYAANEARQREEAEPEMSEAAEWLSRGGSDPLDEDDHRDRLGGGGDIWVRNPSGCFHTHRRDCRDHGCRWTPAYLNERWGPLTFAPDAAPVIDYEDIREGMTIEAAYSNGTRLRFVATRGYANEWTDPSGCFQITPPGTEGLDPERVIRLIAPEAAQEATGDDLSASEGESGSVEGDEAEGTQEPLLCPECGHGIDEHGWETDYAITCCLACGDPADCRKAPSDIARALIEQTGGRRG